MKKLVLYLILYALLLFLTTGCAELEYAKAKSKQNRELRKTYGRMKNNGKEYPKNGTQMNQVRTWGGFTVLFTFGLGEHWTEKN